MQLVSIVIGTGSIWSEITILTSTQVSTLEEMWIFDLVFGSSKVYPFYVSRIRSGNVGCHLIARSTVVVSNLENASTSGFNVKPQLAYFPQPKSVLLEIFRYLLAVVLRHSGNDLKVSHAKLHSQDGQLFKVHKKRSYSRCPDIATAVEAQAAVWNYTYVLRTEVPLNDLRLTRS
jgi:hypothetical protein